MLLLDLSLPDPADNLALDEALLAQFEAESRPDELLRLWEFDAPVVVVGRGVRVREEVNVEACQVDGIPILRRTSGGGTIVAGRGCLMYSLFLDRQRHPPLQSISEGITYVLQQVARALQPLNLNVRTAGISDLCYGNWQKFSGNSARVRPDRFLFHGTILYDFPLPLVARLLKMPARQPEYRRNREHAEFVANLPASLSTLRAALIQAWDAQQTMSDWPVQETRHLAATKYQCRAWNFRHE